MIKLGHDTMKATKNICCMKGEGIDDHSRITRWLKKFCFGCKNLCNQTRIGRPKTLDFKATQYALDTNLVSNTRKVSGKFDISQSSVVLSPSQLHQKHLKMLNCASCYQNIAKLFTHSSINKVCYYSLYFITTVKISINFLRQNTLNEIYNVHWHFVFHSF